MYFHGVGICKLFNPFREVKDKGGKVLLNIFFMEGFKIGIMKSRHNPGLIGKS